MNDEYYYLVSNHYLKLKPIKIPNFYINISKFSCFENKTSLQVESLNNHNTIPGKYNFLEGKVMKSISLKNMQGTPAHIEYLSNPDSNRNSCKICYYFSEEKTCLQYGTDLRLAGYSVYRNCKHYKPTIDIPDYRKIKKETPDKKNNSSSSNTQNVEISTIKVGSKVRVLDLDTYDTVVYIIEYPSNTTSFNKKGIPVSPSSPIGKALLMNSIGSLLHITTPGGILHYKIMSIE